MSAQSGFAGEVTGRMGAGRKQIPKSRKVIQGTFRKDRENPDAPCASKEAPVAPEWLNERAREIFHVLEARIAEQGYASSSHTEALALAAMRLSEVEECTETLTNDGLIYHAMNTKGEPVKKVHPAVVVRSEAARHAQSLLAEFGLTPASVGKVAAPGAAKKQSKWGAL
jgi:P27 family predicted phage terminase small subunit